MKAKFTALSLAASLAATTAIQAQTAVTKPVGYHTEGIVQGFNLVGVNVGNAVAAAGDFTADSATDDDVDFTTLLTDGLPYTVQNLTTGDVAAVDGFTATTLTTTPVLAVTTGDNYEIRQDMTVEDLFGSSDSTELLAGNSATADVIWVPVGDGVGYTRIFNSNVSSVLPPATPGWRAIGGALNDTGDVSGFVVPFISAVFVQRRSVDAVDIVFVGHVRSNATNIMMFQGGFNAINRVLPVGVSVNDAFGAAPNPILDGGTSATADIVWNPAGDGVGYTRIFYNTSVSVLPPATVGWRAIGGALNDTGDTGATVLRSGYLIERRGVDAIYSVEIPPSLDL